MQSCEMDNTWGSCGCYGCGNGVLDAEEPCDGTQVGTVTCGDLGFGGGTMACTPLCTLDISGCDAPETCGNGDIDAPELCDGANLSEQDCVSLGYAAGNLDCNANCTFDTSGCLLPVGCGNGQLDTNEVCDDGNVVGGDGCSADCLSDESCGNDYLDLDAGEVCDGSNLNGHDCGTEGLPNGTLACTPTTCQLDITGCADATVLMTGIVWSPGADNAATLEANRFPIPGVKVIAYSTAPVDLPQAGYCNSCTPVLAGTPNTVSDPVDGSFSLVLTQGQTYYLAVQIGNFRRVRSIVAPITASFTLENSPGQPRPEETTLPTGTDLLVGDNIPKIAMISAAYEDQRNMFEAMGFDYNTAITLYGEWGGPSVADLLNNPATLAQHNMLIVPCGEEWPGGATSAANLRQWVADGGSIFVDDFNYDFVEQVWPEFLSYHDGSSVCGDGSLPPASVGVCNSWSSYDFTGSPGPSDFGAWINLINQGSALTLELAYDMLYGLSPSEIGIDPTCGTGPNDEVYREPKVWMYNADNSPPGPMAPATVSWQYYCGRVAYTVFHTEANGGSEMLLQEKIMTYLNLHLQSCAVAPCDWNTTP